MVATRSLRRCLPTTRDRFLTPCPWVDTMVLFFTLLSLNSLFDNAFQMYPCRPFILLCLRSRTWTFCTRLSVSSLPIRLYITHLISHDVITPLLWLIHHSRDPAHSLQIVHTFLIPFVLHGPICQIAY